MAPVAATPAVPVDRITDPQAPRVHGTLRPDALAKPNADWCRAGFKLLFSCNYRHRAVLLWRSVARLTLWLRGLAS
jgi:hypothetical protein